MEYKQFAKYYDKFYQNKDYEKEVMFLKEFIHKEDKIIDIGCGTGIHASLLEKEGFLVDGLDLNKEMLEIARTRLNGNLYEGDLLNIGLDKKYDVIISMFAVINHLTNIGDLERALINLKKLMFPKSRLIIDLHNPQNSGEKTDFYNNFKRTMIWEYDKDKKIEDSKIVFEIEGNTYNDSHIFRIFTIQEILACCNKVGLNVVHIYENYDIKKIGCDASKNLQFIIINK